jgi:hypothetical protein
MAFTAEQRKAYRESKRNSPPPEVTPVAPEVSKVTPSDTQVVTPSNVTDQLAKVAAKVASRGPSIYPVVGPTPPGYEIVDCWQMTPEEMQKVPGLWLRPHASDLRPGDKPPS